jgi:hypothetical protein
LKAHARLARGANGTANGAMRQHRFEFAAVTD